MSTWELRRFGDLCAEPWANGAGATTELIGFDESAGFAPGQPLWRLSVAELSTTGEFSHLPSVRRTFIPIGGDVVLEIDGSTCAISEGSAIEFDGASQVCLSALSGRCRALNLMVAGDTMGSLRLRAFTTEPATVTRTIALVSLSATTDVGVFDVLTPSPRADGIASPPRVAMLTVER